MDTLREGATGEAVRYLQTLLNKAGQKVAVDGHFGQSTEDAVEAFQESRGLYGDGVVGPLTWKALQAASGPPMASGARMVIDTVPGLKKYGGQGYTTVKLREDAAKAYRNVLGVLDDHGGYSTSGGGVRGLRAGVGANRSATSLHYTGLALDLFPYSGMVDPERDPFVVTRDAQDPRKFVVWARCPGGAPLTLDGVTYEKAPTSADYPQITKRVTGTFLNFTELMRQEGFARISCRKSFLAPGVKNNGGAEWWHFQYEKALTVGTSTFGGELLRIYTPSQVVDTPPWRYRDYVWGVNWS